MKTGTISPIVLNANALIGANAGLAISVQNMDQLINPSRTPILVDEIRFHVYRSNGNSLGAPGIGTVIWARLDLGRLALTAGRFIPIAALCSTLDTYQECFLSSFNILPGPGGNTGRVQEFIWRLPKPLYLPAAELIVPQFYLDGDMYAGVSGLSVAVTYVGRVLPSDAPVPDYVNVPFANAWIDQKRVGAADYLGIKSIRSDLKNPFAEDLYVQKMLGTFCYITASANGTPPLTMGMSILDPNIFQAGSLEGVCDLVGNDKVTTRIFKSNGFQVAKDATPWAHLFPVTTRTLDMCGVLRRNEWYQLQSDIKLSSGVPAGDSLKLMASLIGYRKVAYARGSGFVEAA